MTKARRIHLGKIDGSSLCGRQGLAVQEEGVTCENCLRTVDAIETFQVANARSPVVYAAVGKNRTYYRLKNGKRFSVPRGLNTPMPEWDL